MVGGSGLRTIPADRVRRSHLPFRRFVTFAAAVLATVGCVYFNALYNANRLYDQGVDEIEEGRVGSGRAALGTSIEKAERIVEKNPGSRWADDALRLIVRARILREEWAEAAEAARKLFGYAATREDSVELAGYLGAAESNLGNTQLADSLLSYALSGEPDGDTRAELLWYRAQARAALGMAQAADEDFRQVTLARPAWVPPRIDRIRLLADSERFEEAARELSMLLTLPFVEREEQEVVAVIDHVAEKSPATAVTALAGIDSSAFQPNNKASLIKLRGDLNVALGNEPQGRTDYWLAVSVSPASRSAAEAQLALVELGLRSISTTAQFDSLSAVLAEVAEEAGGRRSFAVRDLNELFIKMDFWLSAGGLGYLLAAETARDEFDAPRLARSLFLEYADSTPTALWAPKAILAALDLTALDSGLAAVGGPTEQELRRRLAEDYGDSPYVQAFFGTESGRFSFEDLEQGLRRQLERLERLADQEVRNRRSASRGSTQ
jgi:tetratricopeptide (TPR) repeat protein